jgi:capsular exopolysaccharide synthesis family protein
VAIILIALLVGGVIGIATVLVVERYDTSMKDAMEIGRLLELPLLGALPRVVELEAPRSGPLALFPGGSAIPLGHGLLHGLKVETPLGLQFRRVYLELARARGRQIPRTLAVTSATRGEGKSTTAACLGITLARELRQKVLIVDFDLRHPGLHRPLALPSSSWGLAQMLGERRFDMRFVRATVLPNLDFLPAGKSERAPDELIDGERVEWFVQEAASRYAFVVMDCAPNLAVPDALIVGRAVEGVIFVVKAGTTTRRAAENGVRTQREWRDNLVGVLINDAGGVLPPYHDLPSREYDDGDEVVGGES